jgi:hypothetical protein
MSDDFYILVTSSDGVDSRKDDNGDGKMNKDLNELKQKYAELGEEIKRLEESPKPWPQEGDEVFVLDTAGTIICGKYTKENLFIVKALTQGNGFRTLAEAEAEKHYRDVAYKLSQQEGARKFVFNIDNFCIYPKLDSNKLFADIWVTQPWGNVSVYFDKREQVENAIAAVGEQEIVRAIRWKELGETS